MSAKTKRFLPLFIPLLIISGVIVFNSLEMAQTIEQVNDNFVTVEINDQKIKAEIAKSTQQITTGLSGRQSLPKDTGMVFYLEERRIATFWMKNMLFHIDIIWIDNETVVFIIENAQPPSANHTPTYTPDKSATHVLEVNAGFINDHNISNGNNVSIPN